MFTDLYLCAKAVDHIVQDGSVTVHDDALRLTDIGIDSILCLLTGDGLAAWIIQNLNVLHAVNAVKTRIWRVVGNTNEVIPLIHVNHFVGAERVGLCLVMFFIQPVVEIAEPDFFLLRDRLVQLLDVPEYLSVVGLAVLPRYGQVTVPLPLVDAKLLLQLLDKLLGLLCRDERERIYRVGQQKDFRLLQFLTAEVIADTVVLVNGNVVTELDQKRNGPINGAAVDFDTVEGLHLCNDLPHGQNMFRIGILL